MTEYVDLENTLRTETCSDRVQVQFFDFGRLFAAMAHWGDLSHAERVRIEAAYTPTSAEVSALVSKLGRWRAKAESNG